MLGKGGICVLQTAIFSLQFQQASLKNADPFTGIKSYPGQIDFQRSTLLCGNINKIYGMIAVLKKK